MNFRWFNKKNQRRVASRALSLSTISILSLAINIQALGQQQFQKIFSSTKKIHLINRSGSIKIESWDKPTVKVSATRETPAAHIAPEQKGNELIINIAEQNKDRKEIGDVNFTLFVPGDSDIDVETGLGNITVRGITSSLVRAKVMLDGDIELTEIRCHNVMASNSTGDIFFDGELKPYGKYQLESVQGKINIRIPSSSKFRLLAKAPFTKIIDLGQFASSGLQFSDDGRRVVGIVGGEQSTLTVNNMRGRIFFVSR